MSTVSNTKDGLLCSIMRGRIFSKSAFWMIPEPRRIVLRRCIDCLVDIIDGLIERTDHYHSDINTWLDTPGSNVKEQEAKDVGRLIRSLRELGIPGEVHIIE